MPEDTYRLEYITNSIEKIDELEKLILEIEKGAGEFNDVSLELLGVLRSLKGTSGSFGVEFFPTICHNFEDSVEVFLSQDNAEPPIEIWLSFIDVLKDVRMGFLENKSLDVIKKDFSSKLSLQKPASSGRVLLVESSKALIKHFIKIFEKAGFTPSITDNGLQAFERLMTEKFEVLVTNQFSGPLKGDALIAALKVSGGPNQNIPSILLTSNKEHLQNSSSLYKPTYMVEKSPDMMSELEKYLGDILEEHWLVFPTTKKYKKSQRLENILYIDDDVDLHFLVKKGLASLEELKTLDSANGGSEAFQMLQRGCPDLILLDYMMPDMDGPAVLKEIQKQNIDVPVIFLTGKTKPEEIEGIKGLGALGLIKKPFNPKTLHEQILKVWNNL